MSKVYPALLKRLTIRLKSLNYKRYPTIFKLSRDLYNLVKVKKLGSANVRVGKKMPKGACNIFFSTIHVVFIDSRHIFSLVLKVLCNCVGAWDKLCNFIVALPGPSI